MKLILKCKGKQLLNVHCVLSVFPPVFFLSIRLSSHPLPGQEVMGSGDVNQDQLSDADQLSDL